MSSTTTRNKIGQEDIKWWDGVSDTFTRETSTGGLLTLNKIGHDVYVAEAYGSGTISGTALVSAVSQIGSTRNRTLLLREGTWSLTSNLTIPSNLTLRMLPGAIIDVATGKTLTINGPIEAGPQQIFSWAGTGAFDISGSPTGDIYLEWWGALTGITNDATDAIVKCFASRGGKQVVNLIGGYRITSAISDSGSSTELHLRGLNKETCYFYIDLGGTGTGFTFGTAGTWALYHLYLNNVSFVGPASSCEYGVEMYMLSLTARDVSLCMGASEYAAAFYGCIHCVADEIYVSYHPAPSAGGPAGGLLFAKDTGSGYDNTVWRLNIHASGSSSPGNKFSNPALKILSYAVGEISGVIEAYTVPMEIGAATDSNSDLINIHNLYIEGAGTTCPFVNAKNINLNTVLFNDSSLTITLDGCSDWNIINSSLVNITMKANCRGIHLNSNKMMVANKIYDEYGSSIASSETRGTTVTGNDKQNILYNSSFSRWNDTYPDYYDSVGSPGTYTKCGIGETDTINHSSPYCTKITTTSAYSGFGYALDSDQLARVISRTITWNAWAYCPTDETLSYILTGVTIGLASWASTTDYNIGDGLEDSNYNKWIAIQAGTSGGSIPTFPASPNYGSKVTDGTVIWGYRDDSYIGGRYDVADQGTWKNIGNTTYIPKNSTSVSVFFLVYRDTTDCTVYIAEPSVTIGEVGNTALITGAGENLAHILIGANKISYGTAVPSTAVWCQQGDIVFRTDATTGETPGWICTTSGYGDGAAVWKAMANVA